MFEMNHWLLTHVDHDQFYQSIETYGIDERACAVGTNAIFSTIVVFGTIRIISDVLILSEKWNGWILEGQIVELWPRPYRAELTWNFQDNPIPTYIDQHAMTNTVTISL